MFKVGDKVRNKFCNFGDCEEGKVYVISGISGRVLTIKGSTFTYIIEGFELVKDYTWTSKFNLGDKVVYNSGVYEIIAVGFDSNEIWYKLDNDKISEDIWYIERNLKFYEEPKLYNMTFADATIEDVVKGLSEYIGKEKLRDLL